jgi:hypothetical protein
MLFCGQDRNVFSGAGTGEAEGGKAPSSATTDASAPSPEMVWFEYVGDTSISAIGSITRTLYRFTGKHAQVAVDLRDAPSVARVPHLRRVA